MWTVKAAPKTAIDVKTKTGYYNQPKIIFLMTSVPSQLAMLGNVDIRERLPPLSNLQETSKRLLVRPGVGIQRDIYLTPNFFGFSFDLSWYVLASCSWDALKHHKYCCGATTDSIQEIICVMRDVKQDN